MQYKGKWYTYPTVNGFMYPAVADSPDGPFRLVKGDTFTPENRLYWKEGEVAIDAEALVDDDGQRYVVWGERNFARLGEDMYTLSDHIHVPTHTTMYTEGPILFKRKGVYYYLYTYMALERYCYYYQMSRVSPLGPYEIPEQDLVCGTDAEAGVFGPGHGCVFNVPGTDDYYLAYLEFGRNSTNRQIYVNKLEFNEDGTIRPVRVHMNGVGALRPVAPDRLVIDPRMVGDVTWARTSLQTAGGPVRCDWSRDLSAGTWTVEAEVPSGYEAEIRLPDARTFSVRPGRHAWTSGQ